MSAYSGKDIARAFRGVRSHTIQIANEIPEDKYGATGAPGTRTVAQLLTHIALGARFQRTIHGSPLESLAKFDFQSLMRDLAAEESKPRTKAEIIAFLTKEGEDFATWVETLSDEFLAEPMALMPGQPSKTRLEMLLSPKEHEMHHRGQLMLIERQLGITPHLTRARQEQMAAAAART
jgi:uncharacterized damage-inducible protein DinB